jgi:mannose-6-phosphate isomerase-like protein (cupin superfamily)
MIPTGWFSRTSSALIRYSQARDWHAPGTRAFSAQTRNMRTILCWSSVVVTVLLCGCGGRAPRQLTPNGEHQDIHWTAEERSQSAALRPVANSPERTVLRILINTPERPHTHNEHDLIAVAVSGRARLHLGDHIYEVEPGDVMEIPRGVVHWAEPIDGMCEAYVIFSPSYDGKDNHPVE